MTDLILLDALEIFTREAIESVRLPVRHAYGEEPPQPRAPGVYRMSLTEQDDAIKKAPYVLLQWISGRDDVDNSTSTVRFIICVYHEHEDEGKLAVLNIITKLRVALLKNPLIGRQFTTQMPLEYIVYPEDPNEPTAPYHMGELVATFSKPQIQREVSFFGKKED